MITPRRILAHWLLLSAMSFGPPRLAAEEGASTAPAPDLLTLVQQYFKEKDASKRAEIGVGIESYEGVGVAQVVKALDSVNVWESLPAGPADFAYVNAAGKRKTVRMIVPEGYHPVRDYPLVVLLYEGPEAEAEVFLKIVTAGMDPALIALPRDFAGGAFASTPVEALEPADLLREIRLRYHVDMDRVYVIGTGEKGGAAAINLSLFYTDWITGAIALEPAPDAPYPRQAYPFLLKNLTDTFLFIAYTGAPASQPASRPADELQLPNPLEVIQAEGLKGGLALVVMPFGLIELHRPVGGWWRPMLTSRRKTDPRDVSHWFRYPIQGRIGWLRQEAFDGEPWEASFITILSAPSTDFHTYATQVLQSKLAYIGGRIEGQRITISTERTDRLELRLHEGLLDLTQPIEIEWKDHTHATVKVTPRISTVLDTAYEDWDFQHPASVRLIAYRDGTLRQR